MLVFWVRGVVVDVVKSGWILVVCEDGVKVN